jgi:hypothetical protein
MSAQAQAHQMQSDELVFGWQGVVWIGVLTALLRGTRALFLIAYDDNTGRGGQRGGICEAVPTPTLEPLQPRTRQD